MVDGVSDLNGAQFASTLGYIYIFNLIIGTGALALPKAFQDAGYMLATATISILAFVSYLAFSYVVESMSVANAVLTAQKMQKLKEMAVEASLDESDLAGSETESNISFVKSDRRRFAVSVKPHYFEIEQRVEIGKMASLFLGKWGVYVFYGFLVTYLYGDLAIYSTVVPKSLMNVICTYQPPNFSNSSSCNIYNVSSEMPCWNGGTSAAFNRINVYRLMVLLFALLIGPFVFFNVSKTKYLQLFTNFFRWTSFLLMIGLAANILMSDNGRGTPPEFNITHFANLYGISVYAFMCHHSLPSVVTPMKSKRGIYPFSSLVYVIILLFYAILSLTGSFAFASVEDVYTLNFLRRCTTDHAGAWHWFLLTADYFLALFPVFTLSTNFPIVGVTLRNNLLALCNNVSSNNYNTTTNCNMSTNSVDRNGVGTLPSGGGSVANSMDNLHQHHRRPSRCSIEGQVEVNPRRSMISADDSVVAEKSSASGTARKLLVRRVLVSFLVILPPLAISMCTDNVEFLASVTGSYAGVGVQYVLPALLAFGVRKHFNDLTRIIPPMYRNPFTSPLWIYFLIGWAFLSVLLVTVNHALSGF